MWLSERLISSRYDSTALMMFVSNCMTGLLRSVMNICAREFMLSMSMKRSDIEMNIAPKLGLIDSGSILRSGVRIIIAGDSIVVHCMSMRSSTAPLWQTIILVLSERHSSSMSSLSSTVSSCASMKSSSIDSTLARASSRSGSVILFRLSIL